MDVRSQPRPEVLRPEVLGLVVLRLVALQSAKAWEEPAPMGWSDRSTQMRAASARRAKPTAQAQEASLS